MLKLTLVTPEKKILIGQEVDSVIVPAFKGELNILPGHSPMVTSLETGIVKWKIKGQDEYKKAVVSWGYCEILPDASVDILAEIADIPEDVATEECLQNISNAEKKLVNDILSDEEFEAANREISRMRANLEVLKHKS